MAVLPPAVHTYHCICTSLLLASTHTLSSLPRRQPPSLDTAIILPVPDELPNFSPPELKEETKDEDADEDAEQDVPMPDAESTTPAAKTAAAIEATPMPAEGYTLLVGMVPDKKMVVIRRDDGFEKRLLHRCSRCRLVVGYEIHGREGADEEGLRGRVVYLLPNGVMETRVMVDGIDGKGKRVGEADVGIEREEGGGVGVGVGVWE